MHKHHSTQSIAAMLLSHVHCYYICFNEHQIIYKLIHLLFAFVVVAAAESYVRYLHVNQAMLHLHLSKLLSVHFAQHEYERLRHTKQVKFVSSSSSSTSFSSLYSCLAIVTITTVIIYNLCQISILHCCLAVFYFRLFTSIFTRLFTYLKLCLIYSQQKLICYFPLCCQKMTVAQFISSNLLLFAIFCANYYYHSFFTCFYYLHHFLHKGEQYCSAERCWHVDLIIHHSSLNFGKGMLHAFMHPCQRASTKHDQSHHDKVLRAMGRRESYFICHHCCYDNLFD